MKRMKRITLIMVCFVVMLTANVNAGLIVYDGGGSTARIQQAMAELGLSYTLFDKDNPVEADDLVNATALIVGWNEYGDMSGLDASVLEAGITGNILITGHDADYHVVQGGPGGPGDAVDDAATLFLSQAIDFAQEQGGTGLVALADYKSGFSYLPSSWGIVATDHIGYPEGDADVVITAAGYASGVYDGLTDDDMSPWSVAFHNEFNEYDPRFEVFENHYSVIAPITIGYVVPVPAALLLGVLGLSVAGVKLRKFA